MDLVFPWPISPGGWIAFSAAAITAALGLFVLVRPGSRGRSAGGDLPGNRSLLVSFLIANGLGCILLDQPLAYLVLGAAWALVVPTRLMALAMARSASAGDLAMLAGAACLAAMPLSHVFGYLP